MTTTKKREWGTFECVCSWTFRYRVDSDAWRALAREAFEQHCKEPGTHRRAMFSADSVAGLGDLFGGVR